MDSVITENKQLGWDGSNHYWCLSLVHLI